MPGRQPFVAEVTVDFEHSLKATDHQALEEQFRRNAQIHIDAQSVVMGHERTGGGATRNHLQHGGFHLHEIALGEVLAHGVDDLRPGMEHTAAVLVHHQVHVPVPIAGFGVGQPLVLLRQRAQ